jgi:hypothetical protein
LTSACWTILVHTVSSYRSTPVVSRTILVLVDQYGPC